MTLKTLVTGVAAAAAISGAAMGVTSIASPAIAGADDCYVDAGTLQGVLDGLVAPGGSFAGPKGNLIQDGLGPVSGRLADGKLRAAYADGTLPTAISVAPPFTCAGNTATSVVTAGGQNMTLMFVDQGGWKLSSGSASSVLAAFS